MDDEGRRILRKKHTYLLENLDTTFLVPVLFAQKIVPEENYLDNEPCRPERVKKLLLFLKDHCSFERFLQCLRHNDSYTFIADDLEKDLSHLREQKDIVQQQRTVNIFTDRRKRMGEFRHELTRCVLENSTRSKELYEEITKAWKNVQCNRTYYRDKERQLLADKCHAVYDAEIVRQQAAGIKIKLEGGLLDEMQLSSIYTSCPQASDVLLLARRAHAVVKAGGSLEEGHTYLEDAEQKMELLPACRETGIVLHNKFDFMLLKHERDGTRTDQKELSKLGNRVIDHFSNESDTISNDYKRLILLKIVHGCLNMGVSLKVISDDEVSDVHIEEAVNLLKEVRRPELWERMELGPQVVYTAIMSRLAQLKNPKRPIEAIKLAKRALRLAKQGQFLKEQQGISYNLRLLFKSRNS